MIYYLIVLQQSSTNILAVAVPTLTPFTSGSPENIVSLVVASKISWHPSFHSGLMQFSLCGTSGQSWQVQFLHQADGDSIGNSSQGLPSRMMSNEAGNPHLQEATSLVLNIAKSWRKKNIIFSIMSTANWFHISHPYPTTRSCQR